MFLAQTGQISEATFLVAGLYLDNAVIAVTAVSAVNGDADAAGSALETAGTAVSMAAGMAAGLASDTADTTGTAPPLHLLLLGPLLLHLLLGEPPLLGHVDCSPGIRAFANQLLPHALHLLGLPLAGFLRLSPG